MKASDKPQFADLMADALGFYGQALTPFAINVWWQACESFSLEQVAKALTRHATDPDRGHFAPKPADLVRALGGTKTDRSLIAWGRVYEAMSSVGMYATPNFGDPAIHAAINDMGGWPKLCQSNMDELHFTQKRFCDGYRAYSENPEAARNTALLGLHDQKNARLSIGSDEPKLIGQAMKKVALQ